MLFLAWSICRMLCSFFYHLSYVSRNRMQFHAAGHRLFCALRWPKSVKNDASLIDDLLQRANSTILEAQLMSHDAGITATELFIHLHMLRKHTVLESPTVDLPQRDKDRLLVMSVGGNDLFGPNACKVQEWKRDTEEEKVKLISCVFEERENRDKAAKRKISASSSHPPRSLAHQSPLDAISTPRSKEVGMGVGGWGGGWGWGAGGWGGAGGGGGRGGGANPLPGPLAGTFLAVSGDITENLSGHPDSLQRRGPDTSSSPSGVTQQHKPADLQAVKKVRDSRAIEEVKDTLSLGYYSHLFLVPKPDGSFRPIIDLKLNLFLDIPSFKMENLFSIIAALQPQEWATKTDLKDAYHHILVHVNIRKYFRIVIAGKTYQFRLLPFRLLAAPWEFTKTLAPVVQLLRTQGIRVHANLDDWIIRADSPKQSLLHIQQTIQLLQTLGWTINWKKSLLEPSRILDFLGLHFNLEQTIVSPPDSFLDSLTSVLSHLSTSMVMPMQKISSITSQISYFAPFMHHGRPHLRFLQFWIKRHWTQHQQSWDTPVQLMQNSSLNSVGSTDGKFSKECLCINRSPPCFSSPMHL